MWAVWGVYTFFTFLQFPIVHPRANKRKLLIFPQWHLSEMKSRRRKHYFWLNYVVRARIYAFFISFSRATKMPYNIHIITLNLKEMKEDVVFHFIFYFSAV